MAGGHPSDAQRAARALPLLERLLAAAQAGDLEAVRACHRDDLAWLGPREITRGPEAAAHGYGRIAALAREWDEPQQQGAKAVLRWRGERASGALVVEVRGDRVVFTAEI